MDRNLLSCCSKSKTLVKYCETCVLEPWAARLRGLWVPFDTVSGGLAKIGR